MRTSCKAVTGLTIAVAAVLSTTSAAPADEAAERHGRWQEQVFSLDLPGDGLFATHDGRLPVGPFPAGIARFTDPALRDAFAVGGVLRDGDGRTVGIATELERVLPDTDLAAGRLHSQTLWTLFLPGRGSITFDQVERADDVADVFGQALRTGTPWVGNLSIRTTEPGSGRIVGGTERFAGIRGTAVEINHITRFDPRTGQLDLTVELRLRYRLPGPAAHPPERPGQGHWREQRFFVNTPDDVVFFTHSGVSPWAMVPPTIPRLESPELATVLAIGALVRDASGRVVGFATELEHVLPDTDVAAGRLRNRTLWTLFLPGQGTIVFDEKERQDGFIREVVAPALRSGVAWTGDFTLTTTDGDSGTVVGGAGKFAGITGTGVETGHATRFDPATGIIEGTTELRLSYHAPRQCLLDHRCD